MHQWEASTEGGFWHFKNVATGKYLAPQSTHYKDGVKVVASTHAFNWHIWPDQKNPNVLRYDFQRDPRTEAID
jgi:hypothetical protein